MLTVIVYPLRFFVGNFAFLIRGLGFIITMLSIFILFYPLYPLIGPNPHLYLAVALILNNNQAINNFSKDIELFVERFFFINDDAPDIIDFISIAITTVKSIILPSSVNTTLSHYQYSIEDNITVQSNIVQHNESSWLLSQYKAGACWLSHYSYSISYCSVYVGMPIITLATIKMFNQALQTELKIAAFLNKIENEVRNGNNPEIFQIEWVPDFMQSTNPWLYYLQIYQKHYAKAAIVFNSIYLLNSFTSSDITHNLACDVKQLVQGLLFMLPETCDDYYDQNCCLY